MELATIDRSEIEFGDRFRQDYKNLPELAESLKKEGIIAPLAVKRTEEGRYILLAGGRRYKACELAKIDKIPVRIYPPEMTDLQMREVELMENICREDMDWLEAAKLKKAIHLLQIEIYGEKTSTSPDAPGASKRKTAELLNVSPTKLTRDIKLADAADIFPDIAKAKTADEAGKMLNKLQEGLIKQELARRVEERTASTPIERVQTNLINSYIVGDFFDGIKQVPNSSIDFIELDPPYGIDLKGTKQGGDVTNYNEIDKDEYVDFLFSLLKETFRVMSTNSWMVLWHGREWLPTIMSIFQDYFEDYFVNHNTIGIWYKGAAGQTNTPNAYLASCYEQFLYVRKGNPPISRPGRANVFQFKPVPSGKKIHPTERPVELIQDIMQTFCFDGARICVPFLGSGNSILAASNLGMTAFGWDLSQTYKDSYIVRVSDSRPGAYRSYREVIDA